MRANVFMKFHVHRLFKNLYSRYVTGCNYPHASWERRSIYATARIIFRIILSKIVGNPETREIWMFRERKRCDQAEGNWDNEIAEPSNKNRIPKIVAHFFSTVNYGDKRGRKSSVERKELLLLGTTAATTTTSRQEARYLSSGYTCVSNDQFFPGTIATFDQR